VNGSGWVEQRPAIEGRRRRPAERGRWAHRDEGELVRAGWCDEPEQANGILPEQAGCGQASYCLSPDTGCHGLLDAERPAKDGR
jgi:hypothetical protein